MFYLNSIRNKLMIPTLVMTVSLFFLLGLFLAENSNSTIELILTKKANSTADFLAKVSTASFRNYQYQYLDTLVQEIMKDPEVNYAAFYDNEGATLTKSPQKSSPSFILITRNITDEKGRNFGLLKISFNRSVLNTNLRNNIAIIILSIIATVFILLFGMHKLSEKIVISRIVDMEKFTEKLANGEMSIIVDTSGRDEIASLGRAINKMTANLIDMVDKTRSRNTELEVKQNKELRYKSGLNNLNIILRDEQDISTLADRSLKFIAGFLEMGVAVMYRFDDTEKMLFAVATYACSNKERLSRGVKLGEGLAGQTAFERKIIVVNSIPPDYLPITSAMGKAEPLNIIVMPIIYNNSLIGVLEMGSFKQISDEELEFINQALEAIAIVFSVNRSRQLINELLEQTQSQAEELRVQQEKLQLSNEELQQTNEELLEKTRIMNETIEINRSLPTN